MYPIMDSGSIHDDLGFKLNLVELIKYYLKVVILILEFSFTSNWVFGLGAVSCILT